MKRGLLLALLIAVLPIISYTQEIDMENAIRNMYAGTSMEEMTSDEVEHFENLARRPVKLNDADVGELMQSGLLSSFQIASLLDYRARHGNVLSLTELANLDGFNSEFVRGISAFILIDDGEVLLHQSSDRRFCADISTRCTYKLETGPDLTRRYSAATKLRMSVADMFSCSFSFSKPYDFKNLDCTLFGGNLSLQYRGFKIRIGDFNARFGQGLCLWNTMQISSTTSAAALMLKPTGFSSSYSFTGSSALTGASVEAGFARWRISTGAFMPQVKKRGFRAGMSEITSVTNVHRTGRYGHLGVSHSMTFSNQPGRGISVPSLRTSSDFAVCIKGVNVYGEVAYDWRSVKCGTVTGIDFTVGEYLRLASRLRYLPFSDEHGAVAIGEYTYRRLKGTLSLDLLYHPEDHTRQFRIQSLLQYTIGAHMQLKLRFSERIRDWGNPFRTDIRADLSFDNDVFVSNIRVNPLWCEGFSIMSYIEAGYKAKALSVYLREGIFAVDEWNDRIYVYERDAPGNFNVPALYGRGVWTSFYLSWRFFRKGRLYCKATYMSYPFMKIRKPGRAELKLMLTVRF